MGLQWYSVRSSQPQNQSHRQVTLNLSKTGTYLESISLFPSQKLVVANLWNADPTDILGYQPPMIVD